MAANPIKNTEAGREAADWLARNGQAMRGNAVRRVCSSNDGYRRTVADLQAQIARLRLASTPLARARMRANAGVEPLLVELETMAEQLHRTHRIAETEGGETSLHLTDAPYLIDLLRRTVEVLR
jgi:hypothetical protein